MTREYFFIIRPKYIFETVLKKKDTHLRASSPIPAGRSQTRLLGQNSLLRKSLRAIKEVRKQKMQISWRKSLEYSTYRKVHITQEQRRNPLQTTSGTLLNHLESVLIPKWNHWDIRRRKGIQSASHFVFSFACFTASPLMTDDDNGD